MCPRHFLVDVRAPTRPVRQHILAIHDLRRMGEQILAPGQLVHVDLQRAEVGDAGAELGAHHGAEAAVEIVGGHVHLVAVHKRRHLVALGHAVIGQVDDAHIHRARLQERPDRAAAQHGLERGDGGGGGLAHIRQRLRLVGIRLQPEHAY